MGHIYRRQAADECLYKPDIRSNVMNNYFSHDSNARNSDKIIPLRAKLGAEGYGIYFMILERLREEPDYMSVKDYNMLAFDLRVDAAKVKAVVENFGLFAFTEDGKCFYSESFMRRMRTKDEKSEKARASASQKWGNSSLANSLKRSERLSIARTKESHTKEQWEELKSFFGRCVICGKGEDEVKLVKDHIIPIYQGGSDGITNLQPLCQSCSARKGPDSTDYRLAYCKSLGIEMPAKWLPNACEMPAIKEKKRKGKKNNSLSKSPSLLSGDSLESMSAEPTDREREDFLKIFFFKNYKHPEEQVEKFINHYQATGWMRSGGAKVFDRVALAKTWEPKDEAEKNRFPKPFMAFWEGMYGKLSKIEAAQYGLPLLLRDLKDVTEMSGGKIVATISGELKDYLSRAPKLVNATFLKHYPNYQLYYNVKE